MFLFLSLQWSLSSVRVGGCVVSPWSLRTPVTHHGRSPSLVTHTYHCPLITSPTVQIALAIDMSDTFACLFLLFLLTLPLHEVTIPLFFFFSFFHLIPPLLYFFLFFLFFCFCFVCFWPQQVGIDQGDIPDLSQVSVHLTFHALFFLLQTATHLLASLSSHPELLSSFVWLYCLLSASLHLLFFFFSPQNKPMFAPPMPASLLILSFSTTTFSFWFQTTASSNPIWLQAASLWFDWFPALSHTLKAASFYAFSSRPRCDAACFNLRPPSVTVNNNRRPSLVK